MKFHRFNRLLILAMITLFGRTVAANATNETLFGNAAEGEAVFSIEQPDSMFIPYGNYPHKQGLQVFDRAAADAMVTAHNSVMGKLKRAVGMSYPVYIGHPDLPGSKDTDKRAYGWVETVAAGNDGMTLGVKWSEEGRKLVENAHFKFYSPLWWMAKAGGNTKGFRPRTLVSVGLTNTPNIPVPAMANEADPEAAAAAAEAAATEEAEAVIVPEEICTALKLEANATLKDVLTAIGAMVVPPAAAENDEATKEAKAKLETDLAAEKEKLKTAENTITTLQARVKVAAANAVQDAVTAGRVLPADKDAKVSEVIAANDLGVALQGLRTLPAKVKTSSVTGDLGGAKVQVVVAANDEAKARRDERAVAVANEYALTNPAQSEGERKRIAHQRAAHKNPELFSNSPVAAA